MRAEPDYLALYSKNCLKCAHLVEGMTKTFEKCHFKNGNNMCPASDLRITITGKIRQYLKRLRAARKKQDAKTEAAIWAEISEESRAFQTRMYNLLNKKP